MQSYNAVDGGGNTSVGKVTETRDRKSTKRGISDTKRFETSIPSIYTVQSNSAIKGSRQRTLEDEGVRQNGAGCGKQERKRFSC